MIAASLSWQWGRDVFDNLSVHSKPNRLLVLCGTNGIGKTRLLRGLEGYLRAVRMLSWEMGNWPNPLALRFALWTNYALSNPAIEVQQSDLLELAEADVLLLDDVGSETDPYKSGQPLANLADLLGRREFKWTAVATNWMPEQWVERFGRRAGDRLFRRSIIVPMRKTVSWALKKERNAHEGRKP